MTRFCCHHGTCFVLLTSVLLLPFTAARACEPLGLPANVFLSGDHGQFAVPPDVDAAALVLALAACLADPDPVIRDGIGYAGIAAILRDGSVTAETIRALMTHLLALLEAEDESGFGPPFAALALAEVARVDRVDPLFSDAERAALVAAATDYIRGIRDYRGFDDHDGWRHGVAHGADLLMQLVLNAELDDEHTRPIVTAAISQVRAANGHFYVFGEGQRLARPVLFAARRGLIAADEWQALFAPLGEPPGDSWQAAFSSRRDLAILHNTRQFLLAVYASIAESEDAGYAGIRDAARSALTALP